MLRSNMRSGRYLYLILLLISVGCVAVITGQAVALMQGRHAVIITGSAGTFCTGAAIAPDLVLSAAHCVQPDAGQLTCYTRQLIGDFA